MADSIASDNGDVDATSNTASVRAQASSHRLRLSNDGENAAARSRGVKNITLRGGVLLAPPFVTYDAESGAYGGFQGDLLRRLTLFAQKDGYGLRFALEHAPWQQYGAALDLVANDCNATIDDPDECARFDLIVGDYYCNGPRSARVDFSPAWLRTTLSTMKTAKDPGDPAALLADYTSLAQVSALLLYCTLELNHGTPLMRVWGLCGEVAVEEKYWDKYCSG